ncbi:hypothetical protein THASP1DRAFT_27122 [Thamnocephalis sphaerospora]|uniref:Uncharacterized protein n=1 Tax=Thamnocephalis sphaerospora TaxID=78915 RepID=A0A4P9XXN0_9FUNG|nr:hypothetical protein THASP1DRAFT_27122 [Thamnocephalis sphaerospora]|eukprot:RKP11087.1 hypothetical protein THASP1DRAFT_27122 [Thamnocephalis sphaerospora]
MTNTTARQSRLPEAEPCWTPASPSLRPVDSMENVVDESVGHKERAIQKRKETEEYERQKRLWEERERKIKQENMAKIALKEAERRREELMEASTFGSSWNRTLANMIAQKMGPVAVPHQAPVFMTSSGRGTVGSFVPGFAVPVSSTGTSQSLAAMQGLQLSSTSVHGITAAHANQRTEPCFSYARTAACRFGTSCTCRHPPAPLASKTLLIRNLFNVDRRTLPADLDDALEHDDDEEEQRYAAFFSDMMIEFAKFGTIVQFKVCRNEATHLRGNMYIQYAAETEAATAVRSTRGRWYASKRLLPELVDISNWREAVCGMFERAVAGKGGGGCTKGAACNLLHVYQNPGGAYQPALAPPPISIPQQTTAAASEHQQNQVIGNNGDSSATLNNRRGHQEQAYRRPHSRTRSRGRLGSREREHASRDRRSRSPYRRTRDEARDYHSQRSVGNEGSSDRRTHQRHAYAKREYQHHRNSRDSRRQHSRYGADDDDDGDDNGRSHAGGDGTHRRSRPQRRRQDRSRSREHTRSRE